MDTAKSYRLSEVQKYITCWNGVYDAVAFVASPVFWEKVGDDAAMIQECAVQAMAEQVASCRASEASILEEFAQTMTVTHLTEDETRLSRRLSSRYTTSGLTRLVQICWQNSVIRSKRRLDGA